MIGSATLDAVASPHSADWLSSMPIAACGLVLDDEERRVEIQYVGLRLGLHLCSPHVQWRTEHKCRPGRRPEMPPFQGKNF